MDTLSDQYGYTWCYINPNTFDRTGKKFLRHDFLC